METTSIHQDYQSVMEVNASSQAAYAALTTGIADWWSNEFTGAGDRPGARFSVRFFGDNFFTMEVTELQPGRQLVWTCIDGCTDAAGIQNKQEWTGTHIIWTLTPHQGKTAIKLLHEGLNETMECIEVCTKGWNYFFHDSLVPFLENGKGRPYPEGFQPK